MSWPIRHLPVLQNWDCQSCTNCCREYRVYLSDAERQRIAQQDWRDESDLAGIALLVEEGSGAARRHRLGQRADGRCVFLSPTGRCRIHERFGSDAKPLACRIYPFVLVPAGDHWRVGLRFSCPSAAQSQGRPLAEHEPELRSYTAELERQEAIDKRPSSPPVLQSGQRVDWPDLLQFVQALLSILKDRTDRMERRWRKCLALAALCRQAQFDRVKGARLAEFLQVVSSGIDAEVPTQPASLTPPSWTGRILFRQALAVLIRKDVGPERGPATRSRAALLAAAWHFARGKGPIPHLHASLPERTFEGLEQPIGAGSDGAEQALERYYLVKVGGLQFFGPANFGMSFWTGLDALALTFPAILWLVRAFADQPREAAAVGAIGIVDHNFGYNPHLGSRRQRLSLQLLSQRGELAKLIGWYSR